MSSFANLKRNKSSFEKLTKAIAATSQSTPEAGSKDDTRFWQPEVDKAGKVIPQTVDYGKLTPIIIKAIQEQDSTIKNQAIEIQKLNKEKVALEKSIMDIQRRLMKLENKKN